ncbi:MAG: heavy metal translocating P-type ATPase, partial [Eubacterium sp.]|nr:heavy metal translocating P-type ATPase [Eubacterium sp.]
MTKKLKRERKKIIIALVIFLMLMALHLVAERQGAETGQMWAVLNNRWFMFALFLVPYLIVGSGVVKNAFLGIKNRQMFDESLLMTLATFGAFATGENAEACAVMLFYQIGEFFQKYAVGKSRGSISELMELAPDFANIRREDGSVEVIDPEEVEIGDILVIKPGEKIPVDGTVISGYSMVNTAALTGEPVPRSASEGDQIISGCINGEGLLTIRAD